jgi:hypothetical protein
MRIESSFKKQRDEHSRLYAWKAKMEKDVRSFKIKFRLTFKKT